MTFPTERHVGEKRRTTTKGKVSTFKLLSQILSLGLGMVLTFDESRQGERWTVRSSNKAKNITDSRNSLRPSPPVSHSFSLSIDYFKALPSILSLSPRDHMMGLASDANKMRCRGGSRVSFSTMTDSEFSSDRGCLPFGSYFFRAA